MVTINPAPTVGMRHPISPKYPYKHLIINEYIWSQ